MQSSISLPSTEPHQSLMFNDNLLLPRLSNSCRVSPKSSRYDLDSDSFLNNNKNNTRSWTAPTTPVHPYNYIQRTLSPTYDKLVTPQSSPVGPTANNSLQLPELQYMNNNNNNGFHSNNINGIMLPSLRHLQLLPDPRVQENSYLYPDTSERTPIWRNTLLNWCKNENYHDYVSIHEQPQPIKPQHNATTPPSLLNCKDPFYGLSNKPWEFQSPVTPPMSPKRTSPLLTTYTNNNTTKSSPASSASKHDKFNPIISEKLIQCVKKQKQKSNMIGKPTAATTVKYSSSSTSMTHKKTNSFKALQIKKLLVDRDVLSINSKRNGKRVATNNVFRFNNVGSSSTNNISANSNNNNSNNITTTNVQRSRSMSPTSSNRRNNKSTVRSRSRSRSPVRIINLNTTSTSNITRTPPGQISDNTDYDSVDRHNSTVSLPRYHKFSLSESTSPILLAQPTTTTASNNTVLLHSPNNNSTNNKTTGADNNSRNKNRTFINVPRSYSAPSSTHTSPRRDKGIHHHYHHPHGMTRKCISCDSQDSPCWRPSWSKRKQDQLCNSCGLRYKKTKTRCLNMECKKIPTKGELNIMKSQGKVTGAVAHNPDVVGPVVGYRCLFCNSITETTE